MAKDQVVTVTKAVPIRTGDEVPSRTIAITEPGTDFTGDNVVAEATAFFQQQAATIHEALTGALPGGTLSNLFALMAADRASIFRVLDPAADRPAKPATDELLHQRGKVLAIHRPCHTTTSECERAHELTAQPECVGCGYQSSYEFPVDYPCETAQALGVKA